MRGRFCFLACVSITVQCLRITFVYTYVFKLQLGISVDSEEVFVYLPLVSDFIEEISYPLCGSLEKL